MYIGIDIGGTSCRVAATDNLQHLTKFAEKVKPSLLIFGGGIAIKQANRLRSLEAPKGVDIKVSALGEDGGLYGALSLLK